MGLLSQLLRLPYVKGLWARFPVGSVEHRVLYGIYPRANYAYGVYWSAVLAARLGIPRMTAIEFGVAGGLGLLALENVAQELGAHVGVKIDVVGFDSGEGMPAPVDYRDLPHIWNVGFYRMEPEKLRARLRSAKLVLGDVATTTDEWLRTGMESPVGFVAFDLDYYSSTKAALRIFEGKESTHLPRVHCYFDDLEANDLGCMNRYVGEHLAIREFNDAHSDRKIGPIEGIRSCRTRWEHWQDRMYAFHNFAHPAYTQLVIPRTGQLRI